MDYMESAPIVKSNLKYPIFDMLGLLALMAISCLFAVKIIVKLYLEGFDWLLIGVLLALTVFHPVIIVSYLFFKNLEVYTDYLVYQPLYFPFIKRKIIFSNLSGKMRIEKYSMNGNFSSIYLIDKENYTCLYIPGKDMDNFDEIYNAIKLPEVIDYSNSMKKNFVLEMTGRVKIRPKKLEGDVAKHPEKMWLKILPIIVFIGMVALILTLIFQFIESLS